MKLWPASSFDDPISGPPDAFVGKGFQATFDAWGAKADVLMEAAINVMEGIAADLAEPDERWPIEHRRKACLDLCAETFDRLTNPKVKSQ